MVNNLAEKIDIKVVAESEIKVTPLKWCSVSLLEMTERGKRLEASVFDVEGKQARETISKCKYPSIPVCGENGIASAYTGGRFKRIWVKKSNYPIFQPSTITDIKPLPDGHISSLTKTNIEALRVKKGQVLLTCSGTIGKASFVSTTLNNAIFSHDLLRITCKNENDSGYLYAYLKSKIGNKILLTNSYGAVITHVEPEHLAEIPIPNAPNLIKQQIHNLIVRSFAMRDESNEMIDNATELLIKELKLPPISDFEELNSQPINIFNRKLSELGERIDASYHVPIVEAIVNHLKNHAEEVTTIGDKRISKNVTLPGRFKRVYVDEEYGYVLFGGKQLHELNPSNKKYLSKAKHSKRVSNELEIQENFILITRSGTVGKVALTPKHWEHWIASDHIIRVIPASEDIAGYLSIFLLSDYGYQLITRFTYGSVVDEIDANHVSQIALPLLKNKTIQKQINDLALSANNKRYEAYKLEQEALKLMDNIIYSEK